VQCILPQNQTTPERVLSNPWYDKGFCEPKQYRAAIDRCKSGYEACDLFIKIFSDRADIEDSYITAIKRWKATSTKEIAQSKEFGTNKKAWIESVRASEEIMNVHAEIKKRLEENVIDKMATYKRENYGKSMLHVKKVKEFERDFEQVQKSWIKLLDKINRAKKDYQEARSILKKAETAEKIVESDRGAEDDQKLKVKLSVTAHRKEAEASKSRCKQLIEEMNMQFKSSFTALRQVFLLDTDLYTSSVSDAFDRCIKTHDIEKDIQWWNSHYGSDTNSSWPLFEELND
jgi:protein kinase C and casein kinase substrate in neurons protein